METRVRTPHDVFFQPQRLLVPLFQRPYVWSRESQWVPLWEDVRRLADRTLTPDASPGPHFLGAVVLQGQPSSIGHLPQWTIIDGQQRLTTLQLLLDAAHQVVELAGAQVQARQIEDLVRNPAHFCQTPADRFKVWPTNRDRAASNEVMAAAVPVSYAELDHASSRMAQCHQCFADAVSDWIGAGDVVARATTLTNVLLHQLQIVVIQLSPDEDAQAIFETLNARGTPLSAADLVKNFVFQRLARDEVEAEAAYHAHWQEFETAFWEKEIIAGGVVVPRSSLFVHQWLVAQTGQDITTREVFARFKSYTEHDAKMPMAGLLPAIHACASAYRSWTEGAARVEGALSRLELFVYRSAAMESESARSLLIWATDPGRDPLPAAQLCLMLESLESWLVRRALLRQPTKNYGRFFADLLRVLHSAPREEAGEVVRDVLGGQDAPSTYWPGDEEIRDELISLPIYRRLRRGRVRMILEAIEDHLRGFDQQRVPYTGQRVVRDRLVIEHLLPQQWESHWSVGDDFTRRTQRTESVHLLGNLTLLTSRLNSKVSHGPWLGELGKWAALEQHDVLLLNRKVRQMGKTGWDERLIRRRTHKLIDAILQVWPVPPGHVGGTSAESESNVVSVGVPDLVAAGLISAGQTLFARGRHAGATTVVLGDGRLQVGEHSYETPSGASKAVTGRRPNGWWFWLVNENDGTCLRDLRSEYATRFDVEATADDDDHNSSEP